MKSVWNTPNALSLLRIFYTPIFVLSVFYLSESTLTLFFIAIGLTDIFDGNWDPKISDNVFLQIGTVSLEAKLTKIEKPTKADKKLLKNKKNKNYIFKLIERPACGIDTIILVSKKENNGLKIVAYGTLVRGKEII